MFLCRRRAAERIESVAAEISRVTAEIRAAKEDGETIDRDQPKRERLQAGTRLAFLTLNRGVRLPAHLQISP